jgi:hypothetical protein
MDTGTLIDVGIMELKGRVVETCSHCALVSHEESSQLKWCDVPNFLKLKHLKNKTIVISDQFTCDNQIIYVSISPGCKHLSNKIGMDPIEMLDSHKNANGAMYMSVLSDRTEDDGTENKYYKVCVMILNDPLVILREIIVSLVKLADLNAINPIYIQQSTLSYRNFNIIS